MTLQQKNYRYSGRNFDYEEIEMIRQLIQKKPDIGRIKLSQEVCERLEWYMADGDIKEVSCRKALLNMEKDGLLTLPAPKVKNNNLS